MGTVGSETEHELARQAAWSGVIADPADDPFERALDPSKAHNAMAMIVFANNAPMDPRMRNELVTQSYSFFAWAINDAIFPDCRSGELADSCPNFYDYAQWGSFTVGKNLRRRWLPLARRRAIALEDGNADVFHAMGSAAVHFLRQVGDLAICCRDDGTDWTTAVEAMRAEHEVQWNNTAKSFGGASFADRHDNPWGVPQAVANAVGCTPDQSEGLVLARIRERGFDCFLDALNPALEIEKKKQLVKQGTAWLAISEQTGVQDAVAASLRVNARRLLTPPWRQLSSERWWRNQPVGRTRMAIENWSVRFLSKALAWYHPSGVLTKGSATLISRMYHKADTKSLADSWTSEPFCYFIEDGDDPLPRLAAWPCLRDRLRVIFAVVDWSFDAQWRVLNERGQTVPRSPRPYKKLEKMKDKYRHTMLGAIPDGHRYQCDDYKAEVVAA